jgi:hypothetical protein
MIAHQSDPKIQLHTLIPSSPASSRKISAIESRNCEKTIARVDFPAAAKRAKCSPKSSRNLISFGCLQLLVGAMIKNIYIYISLHQITKAVH